MILLYLHFKSQIMNIVFGLGMPGGWEWIIIGLIVVIFLLQIKFLKSLKDLERV